MLSKETYQTKQARARQIAAIFGELNFVSQSAAGKMTLCPTPLDVHERTPMSTKTHILQLGTAPPTTITIPVTGQPRAMLRALASRETRLCDPAAMYARRVVRSICSSFATGLASCVAMWQNEYHTIILSEWMPQ